MKIPCWEEGIPSAITGRKSRVLKEENSLGFEEISLYSSTSTMSISSLVDKKTIERPSTALEKYFFNSYYEISRKTVDTSLGGEKARLWGFRSLKGEFSLWKLGDPLASQIRFIGAQSDYKWRIREVCYRSMEKIMLKVKWANLSWKRTCGDIFVFIC